MPGQTAADGLALLSQGDAGGARQIFASLLANGSELAQAFYGLGVVALVERNYALASQQFGNCLRHDAGHTNALFQLGFIEKQNNNIPGAIEYWRQSLQANPSNAAAQRELRALGAVSPPVDPRLTPAPFAPPIASPPPARPLHPKLPEIVSGYDFYGLLSRSESGVEREIARLLDEVAGMLESKRQRVSAFFGPLVLVWIAAVVASTMLAAQRGTANLAAFPIPAAIVITLISILTIKCNHIRCERYLVIQSKGVFATSSRNDHLFLMSRDPVGINRSLVNRLTNDGTLLVGRRRYKGFFTGKQLSVIQRNFAQASLLMPTSREVLAAIGELKNIRSGEK